MPHGYKCGLVRTENHRPMGLETDSQMIGSVKAKSLGEFRQKVYGKALRGCSLIRSDRVIVTLCL